MSYSKIIWSRGTYLSEDGSAALNLSKGFVSSIYYIGFEILKFGTLIVYFSGFYEAIIRFISRL
jgi:hypothetical protein